MKKKFFFLFFFVVGLAQAQAQDVQTFVKEISLDADDKQAAQQQALNEVSRELIESMLGAGKFQKHKGKITKQIIRNQNRYILSVRSSQPKLKEEGGFISQVKVKVSRENLKQLLLENNLFYSSQGSFCLLPVITLASYLSGKKQSWSWWLKKQSAEPFLQKVSALFFDRLSEELISIGFYPLNPVFQKMYEGTPPVFLPKKSSRVKDFAPLAEFYTCDIILSGHIQFGDIPSDESSFGGGLLSFFKSEEEKPADKKIVVKKSIQFFFHVFNIKTYRPLFKIKKQFSFSPLFAKQPEKEFGEHLTNVLDSFTYQLSFYQEKGALELSRLMLSVQGPLTYMEKEQLKESLIQKVSSLKNLEKRFLTSNRIVYEAESSQNIKAIKKELEKLKLTKFVIQVKGYKKNTVEIYAKRRTK